MFELKKIGLLLSLAMVLCCQKKVDSKRENFIRILEEGSSTPIDERSLKRLDKVHEEKDTSIFGEDPMVQAFIHTTYGDTGTYYIIVVDSSDGMQ